MGELGNVRNALCNVTRRLRDQVRTTKMHLSFKNDRIRDSSQLGFHPPIGAPQSLNQHNTLTQSMENLGISQSVDRPPSPRLQTSQVGVEPFFLLYAMNTGDFGIVIIVYCC